MALRPNTGLMSEKVREGKQTRNREMVYCQNDEVNFHIVGIKTQVKTKSRFIPVVNIYAIRTSFLT